MTLLERKLFYLKEKGNYRLPIIKAELNYIYLIWHRAVIEKKNQMVIEKLGYW